MEDDGLGRSWSLVGRVKREAPFGDVGICVRITLEVVSKKEMLEWTELMWLGLVLSGVLP